MKAGGNDKCNAYLKARGIEARTPVKQKYESDVAQLYKEVLKARVEGRPEPTQLPKPTPRKPYVSQYSQNSAPSSNGSHMSGAGGGGGGSTDAQGMERLVGETDQQYIARQTRLRDEARARMAAKFSGSSMGGVGSTARTGGMAGIGSDPNYDRNSGYRGSGVDSVVSGLGNAFNFAASIVSDESTKQAVSGFAGSAVNAGAGFWGGLTSTVSQVAKSVTEPDASDGLMELQRQFEAKKSTTGSKYGGFGSDSMTQPSASSTNFGSFSTSNIGGGDTGGGSAGGMPCEDPNGVRRLTGETDQQYIARQTRIRDEAKARMAAKFGGGGKMGGVGSNSMGGMGSGGGGMSQPSSARSIAPALVMPGEDPNGIERLTGESEEQYISRQTRLRDEAKARMAAKFGGGGMGGVGSSSSPKPVHNMPAEQNYGARPLNFGTPQRAFTPPSVGTKTPPRKMSNDDFFSSFGT